MVRTKTARLSPLALAMATWSRAAPKTSSASARASSHAAAPARGALQFSHMMAITRRTTGEAASSQLMSVRSGPVMRKRGAG